ncbi:VOC family protein [Rhodococcus sp. ZPP]|uniref:VOC family protein n=1 Tax=Rhodococcus sp. ZPP TaxID=2749906 RepID=UPI001AD89335|nr:VOC family protein [Rhodococcus sp. ZPP]QTJ68045.1 VOC family protein [Rhodococcus sp. ZPP]
MSRMLFVNLPIKNLDATKKFFGDLGFEFNATFSDDSCVAMVINESTSVMLLVEPKFRDFIEVDICDTSKAVEALLCISAESREEVDALVDKALAAGGSAWGKLQDEGFMYGRAFRDLDGHVWEVMWMDPTAVPA